MTRYPQLVGVGASSGNNRGVAVQFFLDGDLTDTSAPFVARQTEGMSLQLRQSHGWLNGTLDAESLDHAQRSYEPGNVFSWPRVIPDEEHLFVDRNGAVLSNPDLRVRMEDIREVEAAVQPELTVLFIRWGGVHRVGDDATEGRSSADDDPAGAPWGTYGAPPSDWYMDAVVTRGVKEHPCLGGNARNCEVVSLFLGSDADMRNLAVEAAQLAALLLGRKAASFWMLWGADFGSNAPGVWTSDCYLGYVDRRSLFAGQRALESTGLVKSAFPHPADLWEFITSKVWMATLAPQPESMRLPACVMSSREAILSNPREAARSAMRQIEELRRETKHRGVWPDGVATANSRGLTKGVVKIGWSWEAKFVWFWRGEAQLAEYLLAMVTLPGCSSDFCLVQEWVDFDFELRLFFLPQRDWVPTMKLDPTHYEYTAWVNDKGDDAPGRFLKPTADEALARFAGDELALASAHVQAVEASRPLIAELLAKHNEPVPMVRMDWMLKRKGPATAQVVFGEYCEVGADCLKWQAGPPKVWRAVLDFALCDKHA